MKKLNIGAGLDIRKGWVNLDRNNRLGADVVWDLNKLPLPFDDNTFDYIYIGHVLEDFIDVVPLMGDIVRIAKVGGLIEITVPNETNFAGSIYHQKQFNLHSFISYADNNPHTSLNYAEKHRVEIVKIEYYGHNKFQKKRITLRGRIYENICVFIGNLLGADIMCNTFIKYLFPMLSIRCIYRKTSKWNLKT